MQYVMKLGAYGLAGVAAFAVALALLVSVSSTPTAEASMRDDADGHRYCTVGDVRSTQEQRRHRLRQQRW